MLFFSILEGCLFTLNSESSEGVLTGSGVLIGMNIVFQLFLR